MNITFPHLGNTCFAVKALLDDLNIKYTMPPFTNKEMLQIGSKYSPEEICLPYKLMLGSYIKAIEQGADTLVLPGSCGPCRFGEYGELQKNALEKLGYKVDLILLDKPAAIGKNEFINRINKINKESKVSPLLKIKAIKLSHEIINLMDSIEGELRFLAGYEKKKGQCRKLLEACKKEALHSNGTEGTLDVLKKYKKKIKNIEIDKNKDPIKIAIIGEIYTILEPFSNLYIEDKLMNMGVSTLKSLTPSWWVKNTLLSVIKLNSLDMRLASRKYLPYYIGGHCRESVGDAVLFKRKDFNGAIQIFPMGCMPEIVCKAILPTISKEEDFPIMPLVVDELTGESGFDTRVEAFVDLLERRRFKDVSYGS
ncbi:2-hydroxyglutaryl-CoA dehydratase [Clostridium cochlearium]|uniref:2-hydroxyglutaryl-CoA dehydratase n=1 Tax=Clostridium cochlearium TaxID=1494 RepID=UPI0022E17082|nr:2-hydroxyglutaryl-CoA dehydratase [Clostridium cochlearium]